MGWVCQDFFENYYVLTDNTEVNYRIRDWEGLQEGTIRKPWNLMTNWGLAVFFMYFVVLISYCLNWFIHQQKSKGSEAWKAKANLERSVTKRDLQDANLVNQDGHKNKLDEGQA